MCTCFSDVSQEILIERIFTQVRFLTHRHYDCWPNLRPYYSDAHEQLITAPNEYCNLRYSSENISREFLP